MFDESFEILTLLYFKLQKKFALHYYYSCLRLSNLWRSPPSPHWLYEAGAYEHNKNYNYNIL